MKYSLYNRICFLFLICCSFLFIAISCGDDDDSVTSTNPDDEHTTLRCKINGEEWVPAGGDLFSIYPFDVLYYSDTRILNLDASNDTNNKQEAIDLFVKNVTLGLNEIECVNPVFYNYFKEDNCKRYYCDSLYSNIMKLEKIDSLNSFIVGEFSFIAINNCNDTLLVTEGFFDLKYHF